LSVEQFSVVDEAKVQLIAEIESLTSAQVDMSKFTAAELFLFRSRLAQRMILHLSA